MRVIEYFWYRLRPAHLLLFPLSLVFGAIVSLRRLAFRLGWTASERMPVPVIVVGNINVGGTGKTPVVLWLVDLLRANGYRPGIVTRGYGGSEQLHEVRADGDAGTSGDEPLLLAKRAQVPVFAGRARTAVARALLAAHPECNVIVSDDGMQHYALQRDFELAVVDGERRFGNGLLLPAGPLREPVSRLRQTDAVIINGDEELPQVGAPRFRMRLAVTTFRSVADPARQATADELRERPLHAVAAIGNPARFFAQLESLSLSFRRHPFPDHFAFRSEDLAFAGEETVLMTEKDAVKCTAFAKADWWYLPVAAQVDPALGQVILAKLRSLPNRDR
jgi:tetraacyldisaccharide 4'-kinase